MMRTLHLVIALILGAVFQLTAQWATRPIKNSAMMVTVLADGSIGLFTGDIPVGDRFRLVEEVAPLALFHGDFRKLIMVIFRPVELANFVIRN